MTSNNSSSRPGKLDLKIGIDARYVENRISGIERYTLNLLRGIVAAGPEFRIVTIINNKTAVPADLQRSGRLELVEVSSEPRGLANQLVLPGTIGRLGLKLLHHPDCFAPLMAGGRMVITIHDMIGITCRDLLPASTKSRWVRSWKAWLKLQCQRAGAIVTVSEYSANDIVRILKVGRGKIHVIANAIEPMRFEPKMGAADFLAEHGISGTVLLYVGRADPYKNLVSLLRAFELLRSKYGEPIHLIIAGERDPRYMQAEDEMHRLGLGKRVHFMGYLREDELQCCYKSAKVFVFPSLYEGFGLPPLEAMSLGVPVVSSNRTAMPEVLGDAAVYVNPESPEEMAEKILKVLSDPELAGKLSRAGKERAKKFSLLEMGRRHLELYEALIGSRISVKPKRPPPINLGAKYYKEYKERVDCCLRGNDNGNKPANNSIMKKVATLLAVLSVCVFVRIWLIRHTAAIATDGVIYVQMAQEWVIDPAGVVQNHDYHVGYPAAMAAGHSILEAMSVGKGIGGWDLAGQAVSLLAGVTAMVAVWLFARMAFDSDERIAWVTVLLFGIGRKWAGLGADVLSDAPAVCLQMWAAVLSLIVLRQLAKKSKWAILAAAGVGLATGVGYLVRPEALLVAGLGIGFWLACQIRRRWSWPLTLGCVGVSVSAALACALPYMMAIGTLTKKRTISQIIMAPAQLFNPPNPQPCLATLSTGDYSSIRVLVSRFAEAQHPVLAVLLCVCLAVWLGKNVLRIKLPQQVAVFAGHISGLFMIAASVAVLFMLTGLHRNMGYMSYRHVMFLAALLSPLAGAGFVILVELIKILAGHLKCPQRISELIMPVAITALALGLMSHTLRPLHAGKQYYRRAGYFVGERAAENEYLLTEQKRVIHYARAVKPGIKGSEIPENKLNKQGLLELARQTSAKYLVLSDGDLAEDILQPRNPTFSEMGRFPQLEQDFGRFRRKKRKLDTLRVYRIDQAARPEEL